MEQNRNSFYLTIFLYFLHFRLSPLLVDGAITTGKLFLKCDLTAIVAGVSIMSWASFAIVFPCSRSHYHNICHLFRSNWFCIFYFMYYFIICYSLRYRRTLVSGMHRLQDRRRCQPERISQELLQDLQIRRTEYGLLLL